VLRTALHTHDRRYTLQRAVGLSHPPSCRLRDTSPVAAAAAHEDARTRARGVTRSRVRRVAAHGRRCYKMPRCAAPCCPTPPPPPPLEREPKPRVLSGAHSTGLGSGPRPPQPTGQVAGIVPGPLHTAPQGMSMASSRARRAPIGPTGSSRGWSRRCRSSCGRSQPARTASWRSASCAWPRRPGCSSSTAYAGPRAPWRGRPG